MLLKKTIFCSRIILNCENQNLISDPYNCVFANLLHILELKLKGTG